MDKNYKQWLIQAPLGLCLVGFGLCLTLEAANVKFSGAALSAWFWRGTLGLSVFNAGLCVFGNAILHRIRYEKRHNL